MLGIRLGETVNGIPRLREARRVPMKRPIPGIVLHGCSPSPDAWGRLNVVTPRFIIYRRTLLPRPPQKLRQLGDVRRNAPRFVASEQIGGRAF